MKTKLIVFPNTENQNLRGIITFPDGIIKSVVICLHGFERCATTEKKFKELADIFAKKNIATLRFDFSGCGLSDGDFRYTTIVKQGKEFRNAMKALQNEIENKEMSIVAHSLGACVLATQIQENKGQIGKSILIAPALNQKDLLRYWFVLDKMKKSNPDIVITWKNYKDYLKNDDFIKDCQKNDRMTKTNYIQPNYFLQVKDFDFSQTFKDFNSRTLHIHGLQDKIVPLESLNIQFNNQVLIANGDHDIEKPDKREQWINKVVDFLS